MDWSQGKFHLEVGGRAPINHLSRFCTSGHTRDLFVICCGAAVLIIGIGEMSVYSLSTPDQNTGARLSPELGVPLITAILGIIGWAYQAANARFGVADLFAGEIGALCRIAAISDVMNQYAKRYYAGETPPAPANTSTDYFAVFNNNSKDMEVLDGDVVGAVTQFYANIKVFQDCARHPMAHSVDATQSRTQQLTTIYYGFLAFESGRLALAALIDDRERSEEAILTAMLSELPGYFFLYGELSQQPDDLRWHRIHARLEGYRGLLPAIEKNPPRSGGGTELAQPVIEMWHGFESQSHLPQHPPAAHAAE